MNFHLRPNPEKCTDNFKKKIENADFLPFCPFFGKNDFFFKKRKKMGSASFLDFTIIRHHTKKTLQSVIKKNT